MLEAARGEDGYHQIEATALKRLEIPRLQRRRAAGGYASPLDFARVYAQLGDRDLALEHLAAAVGDRSPGLGGFLNVDRAWDSVRVDPTFQAFLDGSASRSAATNVW